MWKKVNTTNLLLAFKREKKSCVAFLHTCWVKEDTVSFFLILVLSFAFFLGAGGGVEEVQLWFYTGSVVPNLWLERVVLNALPHKAH